jgi:hypothetical protein
MTGSKTPADECREFRITPFVGQCSDTSDVIGLDSVRDTENSGR